MNAVLERICVWWGRGEGSGWGGGWGGDEVGWGVRVGGGEEVRMGVRVGGREEAGGVGVGRRLVGKVLLQPDFHDI